MSGNYEAPPSEYAQLLQELAVLCLDTYCLRRDLLAKQGVFN